MITDCDIQSLGPCLPETPLLLPCKLIRCSASFGLYFIVRLFLYENACQIYADLCVHSLWNTKNNPKLSDIIFMVIFTPNQVSRGFV